MTHFWDVEFYQLEGEYLKNFPKPINFLLSLKILKEIIFIFILSYYSTSHFQGMYQISVFKTKSFCQIISSIINFSLILNTILPKKFFSLSILHNFALRNSISIYRISLLILKFISWKSRSAKAGCLIVPNPRKSE